MLTNVLTLRAPLLAILALAVSAAPLSAACYADYKAKRDNPLTLHYGVISIPDELCSPEAAADEISRRIGVDGWVLLKVRSVFGPEGLAERRDSAGAYFQRY